MVKYNKVLLILILGSFIFALLSGGKFSYFIFYSILLAVLFSYFFTYVVVRNLSFSQRIDRDYAYAGDDIEIKTMVYNESFIPAVFCEIRNEMVMNLNGDLPQSSIVSIMPFSSKTIPEKVKCKYRGVYSFGPIKLTVSDMFGFFTWSREIMCEGELTVYPKVVPLHRFNIMPTQSFGTIRTRNNASEDYLSISDIRKYYPGDSFKKIHWKVSARKGSLHVKNFDMSGNVEANLFVNLYHGSYGSLHRADLEEKAVECSCSIIYYMLSRNMNISLYANCGEALYIKGRDMREFKNFMEELIRIKSDGTIPMEEMLELRFRLLPRGSSVIVVTPEINKGLLDKTIQLKEMGFDVIIIYIMADKISEEHERLLKHYNINTYKIGLYDDIKSSLEG